MKRPETPLGNNGLRIEGLQLEYCVGVLLLEVRLQVDALGVLRTENTRVTKHALLLYALAVF